MYAYHPPRILRRAVALASLFALIAAVGQQSASAQVGQVAIEETVRLASGNAPSSVTGYEVETNCTSPVATRQVARFPLSGGPRLPLFFTIDAANSCTFKVTAVTAMGVVSPVGATVAITVGGSLRSTVAFGIPSVAVPVAGPTSAEFAVSYAAANQVAFSTSVLSYVQAAPNVTNYDVTIVCRNAGSTTARFTSGSTATLPVFFALAPGTPCSFSAAAVGTPPARSRVAVKVNGEVRAVQPLGERTISMPITGATSVAFEVLYRLSADDYEPLRPQRLFDSRDGTGGLNRPLTAGETIEVQIPSAKANAINLTVTQPQAAGHLTVHPCGTTRPDTSNLNFNAGQTVANLTISQPGAGDNMCVYSSAATHLIVDLNGSYPSNSEYAPMAPARVLDTRTTLGGINRRLAARETVEVVVPAGIASALNITVTQPQGVGNLTVHPCGSTRPNTSNSNFVSGQTVANLVLAQPGTANKVCVYTTTATHLIVDVTGTLAPTASYAPILPTRRVDTRDGTGAAAAGKVAAGGMIEVDLGNAKAKALNITVVDPSQDGWIVVFPCGTPRPSTSNLNFAAGQTVAALVMAQPGANGRACVFTSASAHIIIDDSGSHPVPTYPAS